MFKVMVLEFKENKYTSKKTGNPVEGHNLSVLEFDKNTNLPTTNMVGFWISDNFYQENLSIFKQITVGQFLTIDINLQAKLVGLKPCQK